MAHNPKDIPDDCFHFFSSTGSRKGSIVVYVALPEGVNRDSSEMIDLGWQLDELFKSQVQKAQFNGDPKYAAGIEKMTDTFRGRFAESGFSPIRMVQIPNEYWPEPYVLERLSTPWFEVTTDIGTFKVGWRKNVIELDWSKTDLTRTAESLLPDENVTRKDRMIHCWSFDDLTRYLKVIRNATGLSTK